MKTKNILYILIFFVIFSLPSCTEDFEEINTNPNDPEVVPSNLLLGGILRSTANEVQDTFLAGESPLCWVQQISKPQYNDGDLYKPRKGSIQFLWDVLYGSVIKDAQKMYDIAEEEGNQKIQGVSLVMQAYAFQLLTDAFGDIPFSEVGLGDQGNFTPVYESQQTVYEGIINMLTQASSLLEGSGEIDSSQDLLYAGDSSLWSKFANSLKFRAIMRISEAPGFSVGSSLQALVTEGNMFTSNDDEAKLVYLSSDPNANPYYERLILGGPAREEEWCVGENLVKMMNGLELGVFDNRLPVYALPAKDGEYTGLPAGLSSNPTEDFAKPLSKIGTFYTMAEAPACFMSYAQLEFLMAEAAEKKLISGGSTSAGTHYANGIIASFSANGADLGGYPTDYYGGSTGLKQIAQQSYIALFMQAYEAWAEYRRTGVPDLTPAPAGVISQIPSRLQYPTDEQSDNKVNYDAAVSNQGADLLTTPIWWMK